MLYSVDCGDGCSDNLKVALQEESQEGPQKDLPVDKRNALESDPRLEPVPSI